MAKKINIITAIVAIIFSALSLVEGSRVLLGLMVPEYYVFTPLLIYNVAMSLVGIFVGIHIIRLDKNSIRYSKYITFFHASILVTIIFLTFISNSVSEHSINAMVVRTILWLIITITLWMTNK